MTTNTKCTHSCLRCFKMHKNTNIDLCDSCMEELKAERTKQWVEYMKQLEILIGEINANWN